jgi:hypothetical protein
MAGLSDFLKTLPEARWDSVVNVMHDLQDSTSPERVESLRQFLGTLTNEINQINRKRDALGQKVANIDAFIPVVDEFLKQHQDLEVDLFKNVLLSWKAMLKSEISELRPNGKLEKKYDTERKRDTLTQLGGLLTQLNQRMKDSNRKSADNLRVEPSKETVK